MSTNTSTTRIDWKSRINPAYIVFNAKNEKLAAEIEKIYGAPAKNLVYADVVAKQPVDDRHILILLDGFQEVAELRGYESSAPVSISAGQGIVACGWAIKWLPNEEEPNGKTSGGTADATFENTGGWGYLGAMAGNRAFARAVKSGLGIKVYGYDEIGKKDEPNLESGIMSSSAANSDAGKPVPTLIKTCREFNFTFEQVKASSVKKWNVETAELAKNPAFKRTIQSDPNKWSGYEDVPPLDCLTLITKIQEAAKKTAKK